MIKWISFSLTILFGWSLDVVLCCLHRQLTKTTGDSCRHQISSFSHTLHEMSFKAYHPFTWGEKYVKMAIADHSPCCGAANTRDISSLKDKNSTWRNHRENRLSR